MKYKWKDTENYVEVYEKNPNYGKDGGVLFDIVASIIRKNNINSVFDFGCGPNCILLKKLKNAFPKTILLGYDPAAIGEKQSDLVKNEIDFSLKFDMIVSTDCLEHIPSDELQQCWSIFNTIRPKFMFHAICTRKAGQILSDGTNAHKTVESANWWKLEMENCLKDYFVYDTTSVGHKNNQHVHLFLELKP